MILQVDDMRPFKYFLSKGAQDDPVVMDRFGLFSMQLYHLDINLFISDLTVNLLTGSLAVAIIIVVQGAGVSQSVPNLDGTRRSTSRDFVAQGAANVASGFFRGLPVGGSLGTTALSVVSGARTRWAAIFAGLWMAAIVAIFPGLVSYIAMPALGALLMVASARTIKLIEMTSIWNAGWTSRLAIVTTFLATLFLPIQVAVGIGTVLSALLHLYQESTDVSVVDNTPDAQLTLTSCNPRYSAAERIVIKAKLAPNVSPTPAKPRPVKAQGAGKARPRVATLEDGLSGQTKSLAPESPITHPPDGSRCTPRSTSSAANVWTSSPVRVSWRVARFPPHRT
jgi:MFS superfamily sulfate permease-like transporter